MKCVQVLRLVPVSVFCDITEPVSVRGFGGAEAPKKEDWQNLSYLRAY